MKNLNQKEKNELKEVVISYVITVIVLEALYYIVRNFAQGWWFIMSLFWIFFSLILAKLMPVVIIPLFFKYKKLTQETLRSNRI